MPVTPNRSYAFSVIKAVSRQDLDRIRRRLGKLYGGEEAEYLLERFYMMIGRYDVGMEAQRTGSLWSEKDIVLITYGDSVRSGNRAEMPLKTLRAFANRHLKGSISTIHLLPFYPWSSDDGFSVIDYREVDPALGDWEDVEALGKDFDLMFDLVLNHCSSQSAWFRDFGLGIQPARHYFLPMDPETDLSAVVRPRTSPLLTKTTTVDGDAWVWTTFSADQVDLNWQNPDVLFEFLDILFHYIARGVRILRLDAVAFMWKELGTDCIHHRNTHELVKLIRDVCRVVAPHVIVLTETNVPHEENISYFGRGDEAHMVYNFSLPPLLLHGLLRGNATTLTEWASTLKPPADGCTWLNFTSSHDGIGVRPLTGLLPDSELDFVMDAVESRGGKVSYKNNPDGSQSPYELNITYFSALSEPGDPELGLRRFYCSQVLALGLQGVPAVYIHSLTATENWHAGYEETQRNRTLNRRKWDVDELEGLLKDKATPHARVFHDLVKLMRRRAAHAAFHPDAEQRVFDMGPDFFVMTRVSPDGQEVVYCIYNFTPEARVFKNPQNTELLRKTKQFYDIVSGKTLSSGKQGVTLDPYQALWLVPR
ncbi:MAG: sugar phosphorylase [Opitutales bacterium]